VIPLIWFTVGFGMLGLIVLTVNLACQRAAAVVRPGRITVMTGDTIKIDGELCRLYGIAAPRWDQPGAAFAKHRLQKFIELAAYFSIMRVDGGKSAIPIVKLTTDHKIDVCADMIANGDVFSCFGDDHSYGRLMATARAGFQGIWSGPEAVLPAADRNQPAGGGNESPQPRRGYSFHHQRPVRGSSNRNAVSASPFAALEPLPQSDLVALLAVANDEVCRVRPEPDSTEQHRAREESSVDTTNLGMMRMTQPMNLNKTILVVDCNELNRKLYRDFLTAHGCTVIATHRGGEAFVLAREHRPDLIISETYQLGDIHAVDLVRWLKVDPDLRSIPVVAATAAAMKGDEERIRGYGFDGYIALPLSIPKLLGILEGYMTLPKVDP
jgi:two-component system cell cycle response regulator DivK